jgi:hypothetical protein
LKTMAKTITQRLAEIIAFWKTGFIFISIWKVSITKSTIFQNSKPLKLYEKSRFL